MNDIEWHQFSKSKPELGKDIFVYGLDDDKPILFSAEEINNIKFQLADDYDYWAYVPIPYPPQPPKHLCKMPSSSTCNYSYRCREDDKGNLWLLIPEKQDILVIHCPWCGYSSLAEKMKDIEWHKFYQLKPQNDKAIFVYSTHGEVLDIYSPEEIRNRTCPFEMDYDSWAYVPIPDKPQKTKHLCKMPELQDNDIEWHKVDKNNPRKDLPKDKPFLALWKGCFCFCEFDEDLNCFFIL